MAIKTCYLVGGAPLSGKTTLADHLAVQHQAVQISTDNIRDWMRRVALPEQYPRLFANHGMTVEEFYDRYDTAEKVVEHEIEQGKDVEQGIKAFIACEPPWERLVVEGIGITPAFALDLQQAFSDIRFEPMFIYDDNEQRITQRTRQRGLWGAADTYADHFKDKEVAWVKLYNDFYRREALKYGMPLKHIDEL